MGGCCSAENNKQETNLMTKEVETENVNVFMLIKVQAMIRGMLARKKVKAVYGYAMKPGLVGRKLPGTVNIEMDP